MTNSSLPLLPHLVPVAEVGVTGGVGTGGAGYDRVHIVHHAIYYVFRVDHPVDVLKHLHPVQEKTLSVSQR